jgi:integrase/recombinase XerC/integrase/recombinase XerD
MKSKGIPLEKAIEGFLLECQARRLSSHTIADYRGTLNKFLKHCGNIAIDKIEGAQISAFLGAQNVKKKTVINYHIGLSALWTWALKQDYVDRHVVRMVEKPKASIVMIEPFTEIEIRALLQAIRQAPYRNRALLLLLIDTGLRVSEIAEMSKGNIDFSKRHIKVRGKGDKERFVPFSPRTGTALFAHVSTFDGDTPFGGSRFSIAQYLKRLGKRAGVQKVHPHRFRHFFAISALRNGMNIYVLQEILGHSTLDMVKRYVALAQTDLDDSHRKASPVEAMKL